MSLIAVYPGGGSGSGGIQTINNEAPDDVGNFVINAETVGLDQVDNTPDTGKPVSTAQAAAIAAATGFHVVETFSPVLTLTADTRLPDHTVTEVIPFTLSGSPVPFKVTYAKLIADGVNIPTFQTGMIEQGGMGYSNTAGVVNNIAFYNDGTTTYYTINQGITPKPIPSAPVLSLGTISNTSVGLTWTLPTVGVAADYIVEYKPAGGAWTVFVDGVQTTRSATVTGLTQLTAYQFRVSSKNSVGTSDPSNVVSATTTETPAVVETFVRLNSVWRLIESGNSTTGYLYLNDQAGDLADTGVNTLTPITANGSVGVPCIPGVAIGLKTVAENAGQVSIEYAIKVASDGLIRIQFLAGGGTVIPNVSGSITVTSSGATHMRTGRLGTDYVAEISTDNKATWTIIDQRPSQLSVVPLYVWAACSTAITVGPIVGVGV